MPWQPLGLHSPPFLDLAALTDPSPVRDGPELRHPALFLLISQDLAFSQKIQSVSGRSLLAKINSSLNIFQAHFRNKSG